MTVREQIKGELEERLTKRELQILGLLHYYGYSSGELGRVYGISAVRVRQIRDAAIRKIKEIYGRHGLLPPAGGPPLREASGDKEGCLT